MARRRKPPKSSACKNKKAYTEFEAKNVARRHSAQTAGIYRAYECWYTCKLPDKSRAWHVGHIYPGH